MPVNTLSPRVRQRSINQRSFATKDENLSNDLIEKMLEKLLSFSFITNSIKLRFLSNHYSGYCVIPVSTNKA